MKEKRARYISRNIEINQEFHFAHPKTKFKVNMIWNSHFSGHVLWDLFCREAEMVENPWNVSFRKMYCLPRNTRKFLVEPVSQSMHIKKVFIKHFLTFVLVLGAFHHSLMFILMFGSCLLLGHEPL